MAWEQQYVPAEVMDVSSAHAGSSSGSDAEADIRRKSSWHVAKIAGMTLGSLGLLTAAAVVANHAFTRPHIPGINRERLVAFNDRRVQKGLLERSQQQKFATDRALDDSVDKKGGMLGGGATPTTSAAAATTEGTTSSAAATSATDATTKGTTSSAVATTGGAGTTSLAAATTKGSSSAPTTTKGTLAKGPIKWATHPEYCLDVASGKHESGTNLQVWHCNATHKENRHFAVVTSGEGPLHWASHMDDCIDIAGGKMANGNNVQMWLSDCSHENMQFVIPESGYGPLRWASHPEKCLDISGGKTGDATNIQLWDCDEKGEHPNQQFILPFYQVIGH